MISQRCIDLVSSFEGCKLSSYKDQRNIFTIGYGHVKGVSEGLTCIHPQALQWLSEDLIEHEEQVKKLVKVPLKPQQEDALISFCYNVGAGNLQSSTLLHKINTFDFNGAALEFLAWNKINGIPSDGLTRRREAEKALFLS